MLDKKDVVKSIKDIPDHFSADDAIDRLKERKGLTKEQARNQLGKWLK